MTIPTRTHLLLPLLALSMTLATAVSAHAGERVYLVSSGAPSIMQVEFGSTPLWTLIPGTRVHEIRGAARPRYDMFRYGGTYYVYNSDQWYMSRRGTGRFAAIDDRGVPRALTLVSREHWQKYPPGLMKRQPKPGNGNQGNRGHRGPGNKPGKGRGHK